MATEQISQSTLERLPLYLHYLKSLPKEAKNVSSTAVAKALRLGEVQVRKDLGAILRSGRPKVGYDTEALIAGLESFLGSGQNLPAVLIGAGKLGSALFDYDGFKEYGLTILAAFDLAPEKALLSSFSNKVYDLSELPAFCKKHKVEIGIVTVPEKAAQSACDLLVKSGIKAIWNFAPAAIIAPEDILIRNENMASSLALLSRHLVAKSAKNF